MNNKLSQSHRAEALRRMLNRQSPIERNMGEQTPPAPLLPGMDQGGLQMPGMGVPMQPLEISMPSSGIPMPPQSMVPPGMEDIPLPTEQGPPDLGNQLVQNPMMDQMEQLLQSGNKSKLTPIEEIIKHEADASTAWKIMGGYDSIAGRYWQELAERSKKIDNGRDYFISCFSKYNQNPEQFKKSNPREAMMITSVNQVLESANE